MKFLTVLGESEDGVKEQVRCTPASRLAPTHGSPEILLRQDRLFSCDWKGVLKPDFVRVVALASDTKD